MKYPIKYHIIRILSFTIPKSIHVHRLERIENKAKAIASKKNVPFIIRCKILEEYEKKPNSLYSIGYSNQYEQMKDGKYDIFIYRQFVMHSEVELLKTIFHEFGHFIDYCTSIQTKKPLKKIYLCKKFPIKTKGSYEDHFAELFALKMLDLISIDPEVSIIFEKIVKEGIQNLSSESMKRSIDYSTL